MFFILLSCVVSIFILWLSRKEETGIVISLVGCFLLSCIFVFMGIIFSNNYKEEAQYICDIELVQLNNDEENPIYVMKTDRGEYSYKPIGSKNNEEIIEKDNTYIDIVQLDNCKKAVLKEYSRKTKWGFFSIGGISRTEYVFYIPTGTYQGLYNLE